MMYVDLAVNCGPDMLIELKPELYSGVFGWAKAKVQGRPDWVGSGWLPSLQ